MRGTKCFLPLARSRPPWVLCSPSATRGYVYDVETGLYYLRSRYYNPAWYRFVNVDSSIYARRLLLLNAFLYCNNNPNINIDFDGQSPVVVPLIGGYEAIKAFILLVLSGISIGVGVEIEKAYNNAVNRSGNYAYDANGNESQPIPAPGPPPQNNPQPSPSPPQLPEYPGNDPKKAPEGYEWHGRGPQGSPQGNYYNPTTGETLHPDLDHEPPIGPHWDYWGTDHIKFRIFPPQ